MIPSPQPFAHGASYPSAFWSRLTIVVCALTGLAGVAGLGGLWFVASMLSAVPAISVAQVSTPASTSTFNITGTGTDPSVPSAARVFANREVPAQTDAPTF